MDDLISRQAAIDELRDAENHAFNSFYKGLAKAHKIIADLPSAQPEQRWIPCDKGEPDEDMECWVTVKYHRCSLSGELYKTLWRTER